MKDEQIQEINRHIKDGIEQWANICLTADADQWAFYLDYDKDDVMNATLLFHHVCANIGIKSGRIHEKEAIEFGERLNRLVLDMTGIDTRKVYDNKNETN